MVHERRASEALVEGVERNLLGESTTDAMLYWQGHDCVAYESPYQCYDLARTICCDLVRDLPQSRVCISGV